ncbi:ABC transporter substrate-binding protein [Motiliproteus sp. SC1-56]|uniref:ABC transporter substrate-binding protein n=1 Tax=Motiliproteus sp. SC1-56 TaxID=2799565 RepID=UPI001A8DCA7D|nr:ABC transporter substrate-binding protein [Motiliproteus sp. SC1-56]
MNALPRTGSLLPSTRMSVSRVMALLLVWLCSSLANAQAAPVRVAALKFGTLNWELETLKRQGFDQRHGIDLQVSLLAGMSATRTALLSGAADVIVADWIWVSRQRQQGQQLQFVPFSNAIGEVLLAKGVQVESLADLAGKRIGIAGGPTSKGWLLLQARALQQGLDLKQATEQQFGAPPLLNAALERGQLDALVTFWHFGARLKAQGYPVFTDLKQVSRELGLNSELPMLGYVFHQSWAERYPERVRGLVRASEDAKNLLQHQPEAWAAIRPLMRADDEASFEQLKQGYLAGRPKPLSPEQVADAAKMFALLYRIGGEQLMGDAERLDPAGFWLADAE